MAACTWPEATHQVGAGASPQQSRAGDCRHVPLQSAALRRQSACVAENQDAMVSTGNPHSESHQEIPSGDKIPMSTIEERVKKIVVEQLGVKEDEVTPN